MALRGRSQEAASRSRRRATTSTLTGLAALLSVACEPSSSPSPDPAQPLTLGVLFDYSGALGEYGEGCEDAVRLAVHHVNRSGGVLGLPVEVRTADGATDPDRSIEAALRLVTEEGVSAIIGPLGSAATIAVGRKVSGPRGVPTISPSATAAEISHLEDDGYVFRSVLSDAAQAPVLAQLAQEEGYQRVAILFRDDAYGRGMAETFEAVFSGEVTARVPIEPEQASYLEALRQAAVGDPQALVAISYPFEARTYLPEAVEHDLFERFLFSDTMLSVEIVTALGADFLEGFKGTAHSSLLSLPSDSTTAFQEAFAEEYGAAAPPVGPAAASYDAAICVALAAEQAGSTTRSAIRGALPEVCGGGGEVVIPGSESVSAALAAIRDGREVNYEGAATTVDWGPDGDVTRGAIAVWQFRDGGISPVKLVEFDLSAASGAAHGIP